MNAIPKVPNQDSGPMSRRERDDLAKLTRQRERLAKAMTSHRSAELLADFEQQMASIYSFDDDEVWRQAMEATNDAARVARAAVDARCEGLGIPEPFRPRIGHPDWYGRGQNAAAARRAELRRVASTRIAAMEKDAKARIEAASLQVQTQLLADGLTSEAALRFLEAMPTTEALMPPMAMADVKVLAPRYSREADGW